MKIPPFIKNFTNYIFKHHSGDIGNLIIWTTIAGWIASSSAQIIGIALNNKYSAKDKAFMIPQELGDAAMNIGSFFAITYPLKRFAIKLGKTGKILPAILKNAVIKHGDLDKLGKLDFDISKVDYVKNTDLLKQYNSFNNFLSTSAAVAGGIVASNIVTPILRNRFASRGQSRIMDKYNQHNRQSIKPYLIRQQSVFDGIRHV